MTDDLDRDETPPDDRDDTDEFDAEAREERERIRVNLGFATAAPRRVIDGRYEILARQGQGGMGVVYRAHDTRLDRDVALKLVRSRPFADDDRLRERLEREAKALAKLEGRDHVVAVYDVGRHEDRIYFTMPYIDGPNLRQWQDGHYRSVASILDVYLQAARGLAAAHQLGIVHRDFKPSNVLVRAADQRVVVADFGIAEAVCKLDTPPDDLESTLEAPHLTATGAVLGTLPYVAPERIPGVDQPALRATPASDQFSFCVALWEALAGRVPFVASTAAEMLAAIEPGPIGGKSIPRWLRPLLRQGLAREPAARFPSMDALIRAIEHRRFRGRRIAVVVGSLTVILGLAATAILTSSPPPAEDRVACSTFAESAARVWNDEHRRALARHREYAPETIDHVIDQLDTLMQQWIATAQATCVDGYAPAPDDPRLECLDQWLHVADDYVALLADIHDTGTAARAGEVVDRLLPTTEGFCAFSPPQVVDVELWSLTESARAAAILGSGERALALVDQAIDMAHRLARDRPYTSELAEAHAARAEVLTRQHRYKEALPEFEEANDHARMVGYREREISSAALGAKARARGGEEAFRYDLALEDIERARRLLPSISPLEQRTRLEAELEDAAGYVEYQRDAYPEARAHHERAIELLAKLDLPVLLAASLNRLGAAHQMLEQSDEALTAYKHARQVLDAAGVPVGHSVALEVELNLGNLMVELDRREGFDHLEGVVRHSSGERQLQALVLALELATNLDDEARARQFADEILERLSTRPLDSELRVRCKFTAAIALIQLGDPRGDALIATLDDVPAELLPAPLGLVLRSGHVRALEESKRCEDAATVLATLDHYARQHSLVDDAFLEWRRSRETYLCPLPAFSNP